MLKYWEVQVIILLFGILAVLVLTVIIACICMKIWTIAALVSILLITVCGIGYGISHFVLEIHRELSRLSGRAREDGLQWEISELRSLPMQIGKVFTMLEILQQEKRAQEEKLQQREQSFLDQQIKLYTEKELLTTQKLKLDDLNQTITSQLQEILTQVEVGICFLDRTGAVQSCCSNFFRKILHEIEPDFPSMDQLLRTSCDSQKSRQIRQWLVDVLEGQIDKPFPESANPLPFVVPKPTPTVRHLHFKFVLADHPEHNCKMLVLMRDATLEKNLQKAVFSWEEKKRNAIVLSCEILKSDIPLLKTFLQDAKNAMQFFQSKLAFLQDIPNKESIREMIDYLDVLKSNVRALQFTTIDGQCEKIETLLRIGETATLRWEQILEIKEHLGQFVELLRDYTVIAETMLPTSRLTSKEQNGSINSKSPFLVRHIRHLVQAGLAGHESPSEIMRYAGQIQKDLEQFDSSSILSQRRVFEFVDLLDRVCESEVMEIRQRHINLEFEHPNPRILLYGKYCNILELIKLVIHASIRRAESTSSLKIATSIIPRENKTDILEIETNVSIRSTSKTILEMLDNWKMAGKKYSEECAGELIAHKRGYRVHLPLAVNKYFPVLFKIAVIGSPNQEIYHVLEEASSFFPFTLEGVVSPSDYRDINIVMAEAKAIETLGWHIENRRNQANHPIPLIALIASEDANTYVQMLQYGANECLNMPLHSMDVRWCLFFCLDLIARSKMEP